MSEEVERLRAENELLTGRIKRLENLLRGKEQDSLQVPNIHIVPQQDGHDDF